MSDSLGMVKYHVHSQWILISFIGQKKGAGNQTFPTKFSYIKKGDGPLNLNVRNKSPTARKGGGFYLTYSRL